MEWLATASDVEVVLERGLTASEFERVELLLAEASEAFRRESGQQFTPGVSEHRLKVNDGRVRLRQQPATAVHAVATDGGQTVPFQQMGQWLTVPLDSSQFVRVTYSHGGTIPAKVCSTVARSVVRALTASPDAAAGISRKTWTEGPFGETTSFAAWATSGGAVLTPDEQRFARSFRRPTPTVWIGRA